MIRKLIKKLFNKISNEDIECAIDEQIIDCESLEAPPFECGPGHLTQGYGFFGYPEDYFTKWETDDWFDITPPKTEMEMEYEHINNDPHDGWWLRPEWQDDKSKEPDNIHQLMYDIATKSGSTTLQLDPIGGSENFQGGSENFHEQ